MKRYIVLLLNGPKAGRLLLGLLLFPAGLACQTVNQTPLPERTVVVENEYNPDITDAAKVNVLPPVEEPAVTTGKIEYATQESPVLDWGTYRPMQSFGENPRQASAKKGYARLGYGNYGNVDVKLDYLFRISEKDRLWAAFSLDGMNGKLKLPPAFGIPAENADWKSRFYSSALNVGYEHLFGTYKLSLAGDLGTDHFNYRPLPATNGPGMGEGPTEYKDSQHQTKGQFRALLTSSDETLPVQFSLEAGYAYFGREYTRGVKATDREQIATLKADAWGRIDERQKIGLKLDLNGLFYSDEAYNNYGSLEANPYYLLENDAWKLRLGAHVDFSFGKGNVLEVAPDIDLNYVFSGHYVLYLKAEGGRILNDYRRMSGENPYWSVYLPGWWENTYIPLDATLGIKASPVAGFRFNLFAGYRIANHDLCFGDFLPEDHPGYVYSYVQTANLQAIRAGLELSYTYKDFAGLSALVSYQRWNDREDALLLMKPELELKFNAGIKLLSSLNIDLGYEYVSRPRVRLQSQADALRMNPVNNLSLGATYRFWKEFSAYVKINNLLNREYQYAYSYPSEKLNFLAGLTFRF